MKHLNIVLILTCVLLATATGCSLFKSSTGTPITATPISNNNGNIATCGKEDITVDTYNLYGLEQLHIKLTPTNNAEANIVYVVDLYDKGNYRASTTVYWNQPQLNVKQPADVYFPLNHDEYEAYYQCWVLTTDCYLNGIFSVSVHK